MNWNEYQINNHKKAARFLGEIKDKTFKYITENNSITEREVCEYILQLYKKYSLKTNGRPIIAFRKNTAFIHYCPSQYCKKLKPESLIMIDIWARLSQKNSPFADITWMGYYGNKIPKKNTEIFNLVIKARDEALNFIKKSLKKGKISAGKEVDRAARDIIIKAGYNFSHSTGHCLGFESPHGRGRRIKSTNNQPLLKNLGYTIEPGVYLKNEFGIRSEIDFYINDNMKLVVTTDRQKNIVQIKN